MGPDWPVGDDLLADIAEQCGGYGRAALARTCHAAERAVREGSHARYAEPMRDAAIAFLRGVQQATQQARGELSLSMRLDGAKVEATAVGNDSWQRHMNPDHAGCRCAMRGLLFSAERYLQAALRSQDEDEVKEVNETASAIAASFSTPVCALATLFQTPLSTPTERCAFATHFIAAAFAAPVVFAAMDLPVATWVRVVEMAGPDAPTIVLPTTGSMRPDAAANRWDHATRVRRDPLTTTTGEAAYDLLQIPLFTRPQPGYRRSVHDMLEASRYDGGYTRATDCPHSPMKRWLLLTNTHVVQLFLHPGGTRGATYMLPLPAVYTREPMLGEQYEFHATPVQRIVDGGAEAMRGVAQVGGHLRLQLRHHSTGGPVAFLCAPPPPDAQA